MSSFIVKINYQVKKVRSEVKNISIKNFCTYYTNLVKERDCMIFYYIDMNAQDS